MEIKNWILPATLLTIALVFYLFQPISIHVVIGHSMHPTIEEGEIAITWNLEQDYQEGDIIVFTATSIKTGEKNQLIHRITNKTGKQITTKGDNNPTTDPYNTTTNDIRGKVITTLTQQTILTLVIITTLLLTLNKNKKKLKNYYNKLK